MQWHIRKLLESGAALLEGKVQEVSEGVQFEMVPKCKRFVSLVSTF